MRTGRFQRGFTLVEIMTVVAIVGILSSVAIPEMTKSTLRARTAERRTVMTAIAHAMSDYMVTTTTALPSMSGGWNPPETPTSSKHVFNPALDDDWKTLSTSLQVEGATYYSYSFTLVPHVTFPDAAGVSRTGARLDVVAWGDLDGDGTPSVKQVTYLGLGNAFMEVDEVPAAGAEDQGSF